MCTQHSNHVNIKLLLSEKLEEMWIWMNVGQIAYVLASGFSTVKSYRPEGNGEMKSSLIESSQLSLSQIITALFLSPLHKVVHRERVTLESQLELLRPVAST